MREDEKTEREGRESLSDMHETDFIWSLREEGKIGFTG